MKLFSALFLFLAGLAVAQIPVSKPSEKPAVPAESSQAESAALQRALEEAGPSPIDFVRAIENHLAKYPNTLQRADLERALVKAAIEAKDTQRVAQYGEKVLARDQSDPDILEQVAAAELKSRDPADARKALVHAQRLEQVAGEESAELKDRVAGRDVARQKIQADYRLSRSLMLQARAQGILGEKQKAVDLAWRSFEAMPNAESARESAFWYNELGDNANAVRCLADAFTVSDPRVSDNERAADRDHLGEIYRKWKGSEAGLGDIILAAWDRNREALLQRRLALKQFDPNVQLSNPMDFTLNGADGDKLKLSSLRGKVIVMDFWATWCGPCRVQHPIYDRVREKFQNRDDVVFLFINTDEDHTAVPQFLAVQKWNGKVYYEDGLSMLLRVTSIPTTLIFGPRGDLVSRMVGFDPDRFEAMLSDRINDALKPVTAERRP